MSTPGSFAETVKQQADIVRVIGEYVKLKKSGAQNFSGLCPFHQEKTPSFSVHATRQFYHCFGCGVSGDVFSFVQKLENITFPEAVRAVAERCGIPVPKLAPASPLEAKEAQLRAKLLDLNERAAMFFEEQLRKPEAVAAREYLAQRGLASESIARFRMGFAPESGFLLRDRLQAGADQETLKASGLLSWKEKASQGDINSGTLYSRFRNRIMFPICSESGKVIAFTGRSLASDEKAGPKYLNSPETAIYSKSRVLFNLDRAREAIRKLDYAILVEGQMDCISVFAAGLQNVIATSGTAFTEAQARLLGRYSKNVLVNFDPDAAGAAAAERSLSLLVSEDFRIKVLTLEAGFDPDLFIRKKGREAYAAALRSAPDYFEYLIQRARTLHRTQTAEGKAQAVNFLLPHLQRVNNRIKRDELAAEMAQKLGIDSAVLRQELKSAAQKRSENISVPTEDLVTANEKIILLALTSPDATARQKARNALEKEGLLEGLTTERIITELMVRDHYDADLSGPERTLLHSVLFKTTQQLNETELEGVLDDLRLRKLFRQLAIAQEKLRLAAKNFNEPEQARLAQEKLDVERKIDLIRRRHPEAPALSQLLE